MKIKRLKIANFKSFKELQVDLNDFNVLIGANASGKSNFISIFEFLKDIVTSGLDNAISMQGDIEYFRNMKVALSQNFLLEVCAELGLSDQFTFFETSEPISMRINEILYKLNMNFYEKKSGYNILEDKLVVKFEIRRFEEYKEKIKETDKLGVGEITLTNERGKLKYELKKPDKIKINEEFLLSMSIIEHQISQGNLLLNTIFLFTPFRVSSIFENISIYDIDPKLSKKATPISGKNELEKDGSNLAIVLKNIVNDENKKRAFSNLLRDVLLFIKDLNVEKFADKSLLVNLEETYFKDKYLPSFLLSDGTINITALIIALYFEKKPFIIIEEPERNIHPNLISKVINMMKEVSKNKQIIITTHNPEILKYVDLEDILLASRDNEGFSKITRPAKKKGIRTFLEHDLGVDELFVQNLLEIQ